ncbi:MAG: hypothetical protein JKY37_22990, partial [Nannocystaceae bacterium]|nr:hypothetical protein [Nannocystaceae bacterium]
MSLRDPYAQATYSGDNTEQHLFNRYIGVILTVAFGGMGVLYIVSGLLGLKFLVGTNGVESTNHPEALLFLAASGVLLVGGSIWGWVLAKRDWAEMIKARDAALAGPQLDAPAAHESVFDRGAAAQAGGP